MKEEGYIVSKDFTEIYYKFYLSKSEKTIIFTHGYGEYSKRYEEMVDFFIKNNFNVLIYDLRGHGCSKGFIGHVFNFSEYLDDLEILIKKITKEYPKHKIILGGHSLGGLITLSFLTKNPKNVVSSFVSSPYVQNGMKVSFISKAFGNLISKISPMMTIKNPIKAKYLNHDEKSIKEYVKDKLVHKVVTPRWFTETNKAQENLFTTIENINIPLLVLQGGEDKIASPKGTKLYFDKIKNENKKFIEYKNYYHEVLHEIDKFKVYEEILQWLNQY